MRALGRPPARRARRTLFSTSATDARRARGRSKFRRKCIGRTVHTYSPQLGIVSDRNIFSIQGTRYSSIKNTSARFFSLATVVAGGGRRRGVSLASGVCLWTFLARIGFFKHVRVSVSFSSLAQIPNGTFKDPLPLRYSDTVLHRRNRMDFF